jgi:futalosine hydrolase
MRRTPQDENVNRFAAETVVVAATELEVLPLVEKFDVEKTEFGYVGNGWEVWITGVGATNTAMCLTRMAERRGVGERWINVGIAGAYAPNANLGEVWELTSDCFGDVGAETVDGFLTARELGFALSPFPDDVFRNPKPYGKIPSAKGLTVQSCSGTAQTIVLRRDRFGADLETMESAAFFQCALYYGVDFYAFRAVSNVVAPRNPALWKIPLAVRNLNEFLYQFMKHELNLR